MSIPHFEKGERPTKDSSVREKLNQMVDAINQLEGERAPIGGIVEIGETGASTTAPPSTQLFIKIQDHYNLADRRWEYDWYGVEPSLSPDSGTWAPTGIDQDSIYDSELATTYGRATNGVEEIDPVSGTYTLQRPLLSGAVYRATLTVVDKDGVATPTIRIHGSNPERYFFAKVSAGSTTTGTYTWTEVYADGTSISGDDSPQTGFNAINTYYGAGPVTSDKIVPDDKVVLMSWLPSNTQPDLVGFCLKMDTTGSSIYGDGPGPQDDTYDAYYPPTAGAPVKIGDDGRWTEVWEMDHPTIAGERIRRVYHLKATIPAAETEEDRSLQTSDVTTVDGVLDAPGGGSGSIKWSNQEALFCILGHIVSIEDADTQPIIAAGRHMVIKETVPNTSVTINHAKPGAAEVTLALGAESVDGGVSISYGNLDLDGLGHATKLAESDVITIIGDDWIDASLGGANEILLTHQPAQDDGAVLEPSDGVVVDSGSGAGEGSVSWNWVNAYVDSKGHVNQTESPYVSGTLSAGSRLKITGSGTLATIAYVPGDEGDPELIDDVVTGLTFEIVGDVLRIAVTKKPLNKVKNSYGEVIDVVTGEATTTNLDVDLEDCAT